MKISYRENTLWRALFFGLIIGYCLIYAPFGVNETDGGFLTGLAWQVLHGKVLYQDIIYVRPPLPVLLRVLELQCLPEQFGVLGERWFFYLQLGLYSWLGAALLETGTRRWILATFGFVLSAHCYPAMAWHTVDGILFAVLAAYLFSYSGKARSGIILAGLGGASLMASLLCKQSFYPLLPIFALATFFLDKWKATVFFMGFLVAFALFGGYLVQNKLLKSFLGMTNGAASSGQALDHGIIDYFRITPEVALPGILLALVVWRLYPKSRFSTSLTILWAGWLLALAGSYAVVAWIRQEHTVPFAQSRAMFWVASIVIVRSFWPFKNWVQWRENPKVVHAALLLGITWSASISWGYNLPILFATPWVWAAMQVSDTLFVTTGNTLKQCRLALLITLVLAFRVGYEFVYRDGRRSDMNVPLGMIFPKLSGVYSTAETAALYRDLKELSTRFGPNFTVLPAFPQANYLTETIPPLPLDWVVNRETNGNNELIYNDIKSKKPLIFIEKKWLEKLNADPDLSVTKAVYTAGNKIAETDYFIVVDTAAF